MLKLQLANRDVHVRFVLTKAQRKFAHLVFRERKRRKGEEGKAGGGRAKPQTPKIWPKKYENNKMKKNKNAMKRSSPR